MMKIDMRRLATAGGICAIFTLAGIVSASTDERLELGKQVFLETSEPQCALCHTLADAGSTGEIGPILDDLRPSYERVRKAVVDGIGPMQPNETLTDEEVDALAHFVSSASGGETAD